MSPSSLEIIEAAALQLSPADRSHLAERLLVSLEEEDEVLSAWMTESERRGEAFERGEETATPVETVLERLQALIASTPAR